VAQLTEWQYSKRASALADPGMGGPGRRSPIDEKWGLVVAARSNLPRTREQAILETICDVIDYKMHILV